MLMLAALIAFQGNPSFVHEPFNSYARHDVLGFSVYVSRAATESSQSTQPALDLLAVKLKDVVMTVPKPTLSTLRGTKIFLEHNNPGFPCACYHVSKDWLVPNGYIPEKVDAVEISNPKNFVSWSKDQPWMVLHELAHGFHWKRFGYNDPYIESCFQNAKRQGFYDAVVRYNGRKERHYALTNQQEYFAECTEAYFGKNDFFPFTRDELKSTDPKGYAMIEWAWGVANPSRL